jgi:hypothetical protein
MPPLFVDRPAMFHAVLLRGAIDEGSARTLLDSRSVEESEIFVRLVSVTQTLEEVRATTVGVPLASVVMDSRFAARALAPATEEDAAHYLRQLEEARVLQRRTIRHVPFWGIHQGLQSLSTGAQPSAAGDQPPRAQPTSQPRKGDRLFPLLEAVEAAPDGLTASEIGDAIGVGRSSRVTWIERALAPGWIEATTDNAFDKTRRFQITEQGRRALETHRDKTQV